MDTNLNIEEIVKQVLAGMSGQAEKAAPTGSGSLCRQRFRRQREWRC